MAGVKRFEDLIAYQRSAELRDLIYDLTSSGPGLTDWRFREQVRDSASSAPRNVAEGFGRYSAQDFRRFLTIARGSLAETQDHLSHGLRQGYFRPADYDRAWALSCRALAAISGLSRYLKGCKVR